MIKDVWSNGLALVVWLQVKPNHIYINELASVWEKPAAPGLTNIKWLLYADNLYYCPPLNRGYNKA